MEFPSDQQHPPAGLGSPASAAEAEYEVNREFSGQHGKVAFNRKSHQMVSRSWWQREKKEKSEDDEKGGRKEE